MENNIRHKAENFFYLLGLMPVPCGKDKMKDQGSALAFYRQTDGLPVSFYGLIIVSTMNAPRYPRLTAFVFSTSASSFVRQSPIRTL